MQVKWKLEGECTIVRTSSKTVKVVILNGVHKRRMKFAIFLNSVYVLDFKVH